MATKDELAERLARRFKGVPNFDKEDAEELVEESMHIHGFKPSANVPTKDEMLVILYAQAEGAWQIAFSVAHYFRFSDGEEEVDKSMVSENYRKLARELQADYEREMGKLLGNNFRIMSRIDRPRTTPPTGESGRNPWRRY